MMPMATTQNGLASEAEAAGSWAPTRVLVVALCFALNMLDGADLLVMSFIAPVLARDWSVSPERLGVLFSASLAGMAVGCLALAPLADRYGRRSIIIGALALVAAAMLTSAFAHDIAQLTLARLFVGIGVGAIGVTMTAMTAEYAPPARASFAVGLVQAGWPFASIITALIAARTLPAHGWQSLLLGIGLLSSALLVLIALLMPESLSFLMLRRPEGALARINVIRSRMALSPLQQLPAAPGPPMAFRLAALFGAGRALPSSLLWTAVALGYFVLYFAISWIPKLLSQAGLPLSQAIYAGATYNLGAFIGTTAVGWIAIRFRLNRVIACYLALAALVLLLFGAFSLPVWLTLLVALGIGVTVQGGFNGFWALAARLYPAAMRNTGIGWALGVGRAGAVLGPLVGGLLVGAHVPVAAIFAIFAVPCAAAAAMTLGIREP
jgi:benzoate transport